MKNNRFNIFNAVLESYVFAHKEWRYFLTLGTFPIAAQFITTLTMSHFLKDLSLPEMFLWGLPATAISAWYMFTQSRFILLGERLSDLTEQEIIRDIDRRLSMRTSVIIWLLFNMTISAILMLLFWIDKNGAIKDSPLLVILAMAVTGFILWGVRFGAFHVIAAIDYPLKKFFYKIDGVWFSFHLIALTFMAVLPIYFIFGLFSGSYFANIETLSSIDKVSLALFDSISTFLSLTLVNGSLCFALKEFLKPQGSRS